MEANWGFEERQTITHITLNMKGSSGPPGKSCPFKSNLWAHFFSCFRCTLGKVHFLVILKVSSRHLSPKS